MLTCAGSGGLEAAVVNTLSPGDRVLGVSIGSFGDRFAKIASIYGAPPPAEPVRQEFARPVAAQGQYGGGFFEFLMRGPGGPPSANYQQYPAGDLGPGMVESPGNPGQAVMDPRFVKQEVGYNGTEVSGTIVINTRERLLYLVAGNGRAVRYGIGVGRPGFTWSGVHHITNKREWPDWTPPDEMLTRFDRTSRS